MRWSLVVSQEIDEAMRAFLARRNLRKGDLSKFVEEAVRWRLWRRSGGEFEAPGGMSAAIEEALAAVRAACVTARRDTLPPEVSQAQERIRALLGRMEHAIATHRFEEARACADEERKERARLRRLLEKHTIAEPAGEVSREEIEELVARRAGVPVGAIREGC